VRARASFGYNNLVSDMRSLAIMRETGCPSCSTPRIRCSFPADWDFFWWAARVRARARSRRGGEWHRRVFMETHPDPDKALGRANAWPLDRMKELLATLKELDALVKRGRFAEQKLRTRNKGR